MIRSTMRAKETDVCPKIRQRYDDEFRQERSQTQLRSPTNPIKAYCAAWYSPQHDAIVGGK